MNPSQEQNLNPEVQAIVELTIQEALKYQNFLLQTQTESTVCCNELKSEEIKVPCCSVKADPCCKVEVSACAPADMDYKASKEFFKNSVLACLQCGVSMETIKDKVETSLSAMPQESWTKVRDKLASFENKAASEALVAINANVPQDQLFNDLCQAVTNFGFGYIEKKLNPKEKKEEKIENCIDKKEKGEKEDKPGKKERKALKKHLKENRDVINANLETIQSRLISAGIDPAILEKIAKKKDKEKK